MIYGKVPGKVSPKVNDLLKIFNHSCHDHFTLLGKRSDHLIRLYLISFESSYYVFKTRVSLIYQSASEAEMAMRVRPHKVISLFLIKTLVGFWPFFKKKKQNKNIDFFPSSY